MPDPATDLIDRVRKAAVSADFKIRTFGRVSDHDLLVLTRPGQNGGPHIYVSTGIHGDEPAGPEAIFRLLGDSARFPRATWTIFPLLNPGGYNRNSRENADGLDLNRDYLHPTAIESAAHRTVIEERGPFDLTLSLHEDWESTGFYLYEMNSTGKTGIANAALEAVGRVGPIDRAETIDGRSSTNGLIQISKDSFKGRTNWPEQFYLYRNCTKLSYTFETPSGIGLATRIDMQVEACRSALGEFCRSHQC